MNKFIPTIPEMSREGFKMFAGIVIAAFILSRFPALREWVAGNSLTIRDQAGKDLYF